MPNDPCIWLRRHPEAVGAEPIADHVRDCQECMRVASRMERLLARMFQERPVPVPSQVKRAVYDAIAREKPLVRTRTRQPVVRRQAVRTGSTVPKNPRDTKRAPPRDANRPEYLDLLGRLKPGDRAKVRAVAKAQGTAAAIRLANRLIS